MGRGVNGGKVYVGDEAGESRPVEKQKRIGVKGIYIKKKEVKWLKEEKELQGEKLDE